MKTRTLVITCDGIEQILTEGLELIYSNAIKTRVLCYKCYYSTNKYTDIMKTKEGSCLLHFRCFG